MTSESESDPPDSDSHVSEPLGMASVREEYSKLSNAIGELGTKLSGVLGKQQSDFLGAYETHLHKIRTEFQTVRSDMEEREKSLAGNGRVNELEQERDWYKKEALHLDKLLIRSKKRVKETTERMEEIEEDRNWLSKQVKVVMKEKNALQQQIREIMSSQENSAEHEEFEDVPME
mmetsp:Transcript_51126/g.61540  ORF Transcript_51126/g.61540 Transcript_51126/m.61540 type:complete len:175 (-) Transcript_51126:179-703(-)|eukprot:CAMPEP_0194355198 /NCGR_PEP_ID=MMETSP0174-20130528/3160_1 /TAXON_ID=216777 /ORGANISM="Proboscia alata, Strain PI-D3" /LENGTH=174 /DNA_ID=CAMNT_0039124397 /DNA_START=263 /DNA_END=787 /DNA_ORIENTATION=+